MSRKFSVDRDEYPNILKMRKEGKSLEEIGDKYGLSRERIRQIGSTIQGFPKKLIGFPSKQRTPRIKKKCAACGKTLFKLPHTVKNSMTDKFYCDIDCFHKKHPKRTMEYRMDYMRKYARWYYYNVLKKDPNFHEIIKKRNIKYKK